MEDLVGAEYRSEKVRADWLDIWYNITQIENPVIQLDNSVSDVTCGYSSWAPFGETPEMKNEREKQERNYQKLESLRTNVLVGLASRLQKQVSDISDIYDTYIKPFEDKDDTYRSRLNALYKDRTSSKDKWGNFWDSFKNISGAFLKAFAVAFAAAFLVAISPDWLIVGAIAVVAVGCVVMANVPKQYVPSWLQGAKDAADDVAEKAMEVLEEGPIVIVEDIGQGLADQVQTPEGIAAVAGETIGGFAGGWAGAKVKTNLSGKKANVDKKQSVDESNKPKDTAVDDFEVNPFDENGNLKKNIKYKTGEFDYTYQTDSSGRIVKFETDNLQLTKRNKRLRHNPKTPGKLKGDHAGHLAGDRFGGSPDVDNLVSQSSNVNLSKYKKIENDWADAIKRGEKVEVNVEVKYDADGMRPTEFNVEYTINGEYYQQNILN